MTERSESAEVIVIGSGFGGAVSALRLAEQGRQVLVLERGPARSGDQFPRLGDGLSKWLWTSKWNGFFDLRMFRRIATLSSSGVGGGSHSYANVHLRAPERSFRNGWPKGIGPELLDPYYERVETMLGVRPLPSAAVLEKTQAYERAADAMGGTRMRLNLAVYFGDQAGDGSPEDEPQYVNDPYGHGIDVRQAPCCACGECDIGCRFNSKNTLDLNYLAIAEQRYGATVQPLSEVLAIRPSKGGYTVHYRDRRTFDQHAVWAPMVILSAGTVNTVELLLRCRDEYGVLPDIGPALGEHFSGNGDFLATVMNTKEPVNPWHGPVITTAMQFMDEKHHFYLQEGGVPPDLAFVIAAMRPSTDYMKKFLRGPIGYAARLKWFYKEVARRTADNKALQDRLPPNTMVFLGMGEDGSDGRITLRNRFARRPKLNIEWDHGRTRPLIEAMETEFRRIATELGGEYVGSPLWKLLGRLITVHPLGGAGLAEDPADGILNPYGEVWGYPNLFVADGSVIPRAIGPNPALTISALAERTAEHIGAKTSRQSAPA